MNKLESQVQTHPVLCKFMHFGGSFCFFQGKIDLSVGLMGNLVIIMVVELAIIVRELKFHGCGAIINFFIGESETRSRVSLWVRLKDVGYRESLGYVCSASATAQLCKGNPSVRAL